MENRDYPLYELPQINDLRELIVSKAESMPDEAAFEYPEGEGTVRKTFAEFAGDVLSLARYFVAEGVSGEHIAVIAENSYEWIVLFLAAVNSGNIAVPIDKALSPAEIADNLSLADCTRAFVSEKILPKVSAEGVSICPIEKVGELISKGKDSGAELPEIDRDALAAIFFTSGTTGRNKGVMLSHKNMAADINFACKNFRLDGSTVSFLPYHHTFGLITAVFKVINYGKCTFINRELKKLQKELQAAGPTLVFMVPLFVESFSKLMLRAESSGIPGKMLFGGKLEFIISGGAPLNDKYIGFYRERGITILNGYGITECAPVVAVNRNLFQKAGSVGKILCGCSAKISEEGNILIKGDNVMLGYYKDEKATAGVLRDGWFDTGDIGCIDGDDFLYITGREKNLIILSNGENVSPEEIENRFLSDSKTAEVIVFDDGGVLTAEIFPAEDKLGDKAYFDALAARINSDSPMHKRVNKLILRDKPFERNTSGKIIRSKNGGGKNA